MGYLRTGQQLKRPLVVGITVRRLVLSGHPEVVRRLEDLMAVLQALGGRQATFRTLDVGGEKLPLAIAIRGGSNPSLGMRAIRFAFRHPDIFRTQLRALYRASAAGPLRILFPLVSGVSELDEARRACAGVVDELAREGVTFDREVPIGLMIETPSAALTTDQVKALQTADLAAFKTSQIAALSTEQIKVGLTADQVAALTSAQVAGDPAFTWILLGLGVRGLSMSPRSIPAVKSVIGQSRMDEMEDLVAKALALRSEIEVEELVLGIMRGRFPLELAGSDDV